MNCSVCNGDDFDLRDGYQYCTECGTRLADTQATIEYGDDEYSKRGVTKTKFKSDSFKAGSIWTTWHAHNMILAGLAEELGCCCNTMEFKKTTLKLWGMFLKMNKIAFYSRTSAPLQPKLVYGCHRKDLEYLYDQKRSKKINKNITSTSSTTTQLKIKKSKTLTRHFKRLISSQKTDIASQSLMELKSSSQTIEKPSCIILSNNLKKLCNKNMSKEDIKTHIRNGFCGSNCNCLFQRRRFSTLQNRNNLSIFNLYAILVLALRINNENVQMSDFLRWCREGHVSYSSYDHFFPEDMVIKSKDPKFKIRPLILNDRKLRQVAGLFAKEFEFEVIKSPNIEYLIYKYIKELELPQEFNDYILNLAEVTGQLSDFKPSEKNTILPNYEAIIMSYVIIALKMIFGLDDITEKEISFHCNKINAILSLKRQSKKLRIEDMIKMENSETNTRLKTIFVWQNWVEYIEYRKICLSEYHYPTRIRTYKEDYEKPELFLHHKKTIKKDFEKEYENRNEMHSLIKTLIDDIEFQYDEIEEMFPVFPVSLYPMSSYIESLLIWKHPSQMDVNRAILEEDFINYGLSVFFDYSVLEDILNKNNIKLIVYRARERKLCVTKSDINTENLQTNMSLNSSKDVEVINCTVSKWKEILFSEKISEILLKGLTKDEKSRQSNNHKKQQTCAFASSSTQGENINIKQDVESRYTETVKLNLCLEDYWVRHYKYDKTFTKISFEKELDMYFPNSFSWLLRECANIIETSALQLYVELCKIEKKLITFLKKDNTNK